MATVNYAARQICPKVVLYGESSDTLIDRLYDLYEDQKKSDLKDIQTGDISVHFFDALDDKYTIRKFPTKWQYYNVPLEIYANATRKLVLRGVDGILIKWKLDNGIFLEDENRDLIYEIENNLAEYGYVYKNITIHSFVDSEDALDTNSDVLDSIANFAKGSLNAGFSIGLLQGSENLKELVVRDLNERYSAPPNFTHPSIPQPKMPSSTLVEPKSKVSKESLRKLFSTPEKSSIQTYSTPQLDDVGKKLDQFFSTDVDSSSKEHADIQKELEKLQHLIHKCYAEKGYREPLKHPYFVKQALYCLEHPWRFRDTETGKNVKKTRDEMRAILQPKKTESDLLLLPSDGKNIGWEEVKVFISSTFSDFHAERDYLVKQVFPMIREWCEKYRLHFYDIDLRWGISEEDEQNGKVIEICLGEIDGSRPLFLCFLGNRYGYVPAKTSIPLNIAQKYPLVQKEKDSSITAMEIEYALSDSVGAQWSMSNLDGFFYFRSPNTFPFPNSIKFETHEQYDRYGKTFFEYSKENNEKLSNLKGKITSFFQSRNEVEKRIFNYAPMFKLTSPPYGNSLPGMIIPESFNDLGNRVIQDIKAAIGSNHKKRIEYLENASNTGVINEHDYHEQFAMSRNKLFIGREKLIGLLKKEIDSNDSKIIALLGEAGSGKSALLANLYYQLKMESDYVLPHFIGSSPQSTDLKILLTKLCQFLKKVYMEEVVSVKHRKIETIEVKLKPIVETLEKQVSENEELDSEITNKYDQLTEEIHNIRMEIQKKKNDFKIPDDIESLQFTFIRFITECKLIKSKIVILIDGLNQLSSRFNAERLFWLPEHVPENVKIVCSTLEGAVQKELLKKNCNLIRISKLTEREQLEILDKVPSLFCKRLDDYQKQLILKHSESSNPLYLRLALEELRVYGSFELLNQKIEALPESLPRLFESLLKRLEDEFGTVLCRKMFSLLATSKSGLTHQEISALLGSEDVEKKHQIILRQIRDYLSFKGELVDFHHRIFAKEVKKRYLKFEQERLEIHTILTNYFKELSFKGDSDIYSERKLDELGWQAVLSRDSTLIREVLMDKEYIGAKLKTGRLSELEEEFGLALKNYSSNSLWSEHSFFPGFEVTSKQELLETAPRLEKDDIDVIKRTVFAEASLNSDTEDNFYILLRGVYNCLTNLIWFDVSKLDFDSFIESSFLPDSSEKENFIPFPLTNGFVFDDEGACDIVTVTCDGTMAAWGGSNGKIRIYNVKEKYTVQLLQYDGADISSLNFSFDKDQLVSGHTNGEVCVWSTTDGILEDTYKISDDPIVAVGITIDGAIAFGNTSKGRAFVIDSLEGVIDSKLIDAQKAERIKKRYPYTPIIKNDDEYTIEALANIKNVDEGIASSTFYSTPEIKVEFKNNTLVLSKDNDLKETQIDNSFYSLCATQDVAVVMVIDAQNRDVVFWNTKDNSYKKQMLRQEMVCSCSISSNGTVAVTGSKEGIVRFWDPLRGEEIKWLSGPDKVHAYMNNVLKYTIELFNKKEYAEGNTLLENILFKYIKANSDDSSFKEKVYKAIRNIDGLSSIVIA